MASVEPGLLHTRIVETLHGWQQKMKDRERPLPTYAEVEGLRSQVAQLERHDAHLSQPLNSRLDRIEEQLGDAYQKRVDAILDHLELSRGSEFAWREAVNEVRTLITELQRFSPTLIEDRNQQLLDAQHRLEGERLLEDARRDERETRAKLDGEAKTEGVSSLRLVREARSLVDRVAKRVEEARRKEAPEDLVRQVSDVEVSSRKYVDDLRKKVADDALTYDLNEEFTDAYQLLLDIRNEDGPTTKVRYHYLVEEVLEGSEEPEIVVREPAQVEVQAAIEACLWRWSSNLEPRAKRHLDAAEQALLHHDPIKANSELDEVDSVAKGLALERLTGDTKGRLSRLREQCARDMETFMTFEREIGKAAELAPGITAWDSLIGLGKRYEHFQATSNIWQQEYRNTHERVVRESQQELKKTRTATAAHKLEHGRQQVRGVLEPLSPHAGAFPEVYREATMLSNLIDVLDTRLPAIERKLKGREERELEKTQAELAEIQGLLDQAGIGQQSEYQRLMDIRDAFTNADKLLERLRTDARQTDSTERLHELASELEDHVQNVPEEFRLDFQSLLEYVQARLNLLFGGQILQVAADYDRAVQHFKEAMKHPEFQDEAQQGLAWLQSQLIPANEKVRRALTEASRGVRAGNFWLAYEQLQRVSGAPAEKGLKAKCQEQLAANREKARMQSRDTLQQALDEGRGQSSELREHARRLRILDAGSPVVQDPRLWPLIHQLAGQEALKANDWRSAASYFESAATAATETSDERVQASAHRFHLKAMAALKQFILSQSPLLDPAIAIEVVTGKLQGDYRGDADLLLNHSESLERRAQQVEGDWLDTSFAGDSVGADTGAGRESESLRTALALRREAKQLAGKAAQNADRWVLPGAAPEYEQERITMLEADPQVETEGRRRQAAGLQKALAEGIELVAAKIYIVDRIP